MKFSTKRIRQYPTHFTHCYCTTLGNKVIFLHIFSRFFMSLFYHLFTIVINLWHQKFVTADVIAVFVNKQQLQHGIQRRKQDFDKKFVFKEVHSKEVDRQIS